MLTAIVLSFPLALLLSYVVVPQRRKSKVIAKAYGAMVFMYLVIIYSCASSSANQTSYILRSGMLSQIGLMLVSIYAIIETIGDWKQ